MTNLRDAKIDTDIATNVRETAEAYKTKQTAVTEAHVRLALAQLYAIEKRDESQQEALTDLNSEITQAG